MADNVVISAGAGGDTIAADDVGGAKYQRVKCVWGADGSVNDTSAAAPLPINVTTLPTLTKGTQGSTGLSTQDLKDAGRNVTNYFHALPIITTAAEVMQSLTGYKGGIAVAATVTPAVVTAGKTYRVQKIVLTYIATATMGSMLVNLRANLAGVAIVTSPLVHSWVVGTSAATAGVSTTVTIPFPDGLEFAAGTGIAVGVTGLNATQAAAIVGYAQVSILGYEY